MIDRREGRVPVATDRPTTFACPFCGRTATYTPRGARIPLVEHDEPWCERFSECDFDRPAASARAREPADLIEQYPERREPGPVRAELVEAVPGEAVAAALDLRGGRGKVDR